MLICLVVVAGCGRAESPHPSGAAPTTATSHGSASPRVLEGVWQTRPVSVDQMVATLRGAGLEQWIQPFRAKAGMGESNVFRLTIEGGHWREEYSRDGGPFIDFDDASYRVQGDVVVLSRGAGSYRWSVEGDALRLAFVDGSMTGDDPQTGIPGEAEQRAFYTSAPFHRRGHT
jgi:hypothetical protein